MAHILPLFAVIVGPYLPSPLACLPPFLVSPPSHSCPACCPVLPYAARSSSARQPCNSRCYPHWAVIEAEEFDPGWAGKELWKQ